MRTCRLTSPRAFGWLLSLGVALASGEALAARKAFFSAPASAECFITVSNPSSSDLTLSWDVSGGDGLNGWTHVSAEQQEVPAVLGGGPLCAAPCSTGTLRAGAAVQLAFVKDGALMGSFSGYLSLLETTGFALASGHCLSKDTNVPFVIYGGLPF